MKTTLVKETESLEREGVKFSFVATNLRGRELFSYNKNWKFCSQSTIKAPFVCSLLDYKPELFNAHREQIRQIITVSSNSAYEELFEKYGNENLAKWCEDVFVDPETVSRIYPRQITVSDMARLWTKMYEYLSDRAPKELVAWFYGTKYSAIYSALGGKYKTWTKAGWENGIDDGDEIGSTKIPDPIYTDGDPLNDETSTNDTGIVFSPKTPYILAIFTNIPTNPPRLEGLVRAIDEQINETEL